MKQKEKKARNRRTNEQIDKEVISELEKLVAEYGFGNVNLSALMKAANIEANVFYRRYGSMDNLYDRLAKQYDFWINDAIDVSSLNILGPKKFFAETFKTLYRNLSDNTVMQKLLLYEMSVINETTKRTAETRDIMNLNLIAFYDNLFKPAKINIKAISTICPNSSDAWPAAPPAGSLDMRPVHCRQVTEPSAILPPRDIARRFKWLPAVQTLQRLPFLLMGMRGG